MEKEGGGEISSILYHCATHARVLPREPLRTRFRGALAVGKS